MAKDTHTPTHLDNPFWQFSLQYWANQAAQHALLKLQDDHQQHINLVLFSIWLSTEHNASIHPYIQEAYSLSTQWQRDVVTQLRAARRALSDSSHLKQSILNVELEAERIEQALLYELVLENQSRLDEHTEALTCLLNNLKCCIEQSQEPIDAIPNALLIALIQAVYPSLDLEKIQLKLAEWSTSSRRTT